MHQSGLVIFFRLAADISPDMLEEETDPASDSDADLKYKLFQESTNFHHPIVKHPPETVGAQPLLPGTKNAKEIYNQEHVHSGATPGAGLTTSTSLPPSLPSPSVIATADTSATSTPVDRTQDSDDVEKCYLELQPKVTVEPTCEVGDRPPSAPPCGQQKDAEGDEETNGEYSADEVSVSRSSSRSPLAGLLVVAERVAGGGSASPSDSETLLTASKPTSLRLPQQRVRGDHFSFVLPSSPFSRNFMTRGLIVGRSLDDAQPRLLFTNNVVCTVSL